MIGHTSLVSDLLLSCGHIPTHAKLNRAYASLQIRTPSPPPPPHPPTCGSTLLSGVSAPMQPVLLSTLFGKAEAAGVQVSPLGRWLAWLARSDGVLNLWVAALPLESPNGISGALQLTAATDRDICFCFRFTCDDRSILYLRETEHGSELYHLYAVDLPTGGETPDPVPCGRDLLAGFPKRTCAVGFVGGMQLWLPPSTPRRAILATGRGSLLWDLSALDLDTCELTSLEVNPASSRTGLAVLTWQLLTHHFLVLVARLVALLTLGLCVLRAEELVPPPCAPLQYFVDHAGCVIGCAQACISFGLALRFSRKTRGGRWERACPDVPFDRLNMQLVGSGAATGTMRFDRLDTDEGGSIAIHTCDYADTTAYVKFPAGVALAHDKRADIDGFITNPSSGAVELVTVTADRTEHIPIGRAGERLQAELGRLRDALACGPETQLTICSRTLDDGQWVIRTTSETSAATFYLQPPYQSSKPPQRLVCARPLLEALPLVPTEPVVIPARDGEGLPAYLTRPHTQADTGSGPPPLVLVLHGGPNARDTPDFDPVTQLLAARGMAVLSVNYRGSTGFGMRFAGLGNGNLRGMHNDVEDARDWAISSGLADPKRMAVLGGSWGGYLALGAATGIATRRDQPTESCAQRYAAVVAIVPLVAVGAANTSRAFRGDPLVRRYWDQVYGPRVSRHTAAAARLSPLHRLDSLSSDVKLLLIHSECDPRVPQDHSDSVARAAQRLGLTGAHLVYGKEGHSIRREPNVLHMWRAVEQFLCSTLALPPPPPFEPQTEGHTCTVRWNNTGCSL